MISAMAVPSFISIPPELADVDPAWLRLVGTGIHRSVKRARRRARHNLPEISQHEISGSRSGAAAGTGSAGTLQRAPQPADDDAAGAVVSRGRDLIVDIEHQFRHLVVPVEMRHRLRSQPAAARDVQ